jgi:citrate lyase subunit beta/citryl-CoA lyase
MPGTRPIRSYLYAPASSERIISKVLDAGSDCVILDLEETVADADKQRARESAIAFIDEHAATASQQLHVRVNRGRFGFDSDDVHAVARPGLAAIRVPRVEDPRDLRVLDDVLTTVELDAGLEPDSIGVYVTIESARGLHHLEGLAASPRVVRLCFGSADFLADIGGRGGHGYRSTLYARSQMVIASRVAGIQAPVDSVHTNLDDLEGLRAGAEIARDLGFFGKSVIHPKQLDAVHEVFTPTAEEVTAAKEVIRRFEEAQARGDAALDLEGAFIDPAIVARARGVLDLT